MKTLKSWITHIDEVWKHIKKAYDLVESRRLWQIHIEKWLLSIGFTTVHGLPQFFIHRRNGLICLFLAKVVDDILIYCTREQSYLFYQQVYSRLKIQFHTQAMENTTTFNGTSIRQDKNFKIYVNVTE